MNSSNPTSTLPTFGGFGFGSKPVGTSQPSLSTPGFNFGSTPATSGFGLTVSSATPTTANQPTGTGFTMPTVTSSGLSFGLPAATSATGTTGFSLGATGTTQASVTGTSAPMGASVNFAQMDEVIQKWTLELVEQEKLFLNQMDQVRDWDRLLLTTGDKIAALNQGMEKVQLRQQQLNHELDFIVAQQRELAECLIPLEKEFSGIDVSDPERNSVYERAENLNTQLQQISEDLKSVIEHINERNRSQDTNDPIVQIGKILNAHMNSLQWVDQNTSLIQQTLEQISKMRDIHRRDADSTQNL